jgi:predicted DNA-binding WGR domain protein
MRRFYRLDLQPDLFGGVTLVKEWGRIGRGGQVRSIAFDDQTAALEALEAMRRAKECRGYQGYDR